MVFQQAQSGGQLRGVFQYLQDFGFLDFVLPFILIFVVIFAILQMVPLFQVKKKDAQGNPEKYPAGHPNAGKDIMLGDRKINALIGIAIALMVTIPHAAGIYPTDMDPVTLISSFLPSTVVVLAAVFVIMMLLGFAGASEKSALQLLIAAIGVGLLVFLFALNIFPTFFPSGFYWLADPTIQALLFVLLIMGLVVYWVMKPEPKPGEDLPTTLKAWMTVRHPP
jgi:NADH:ubiquinone oxidoreductase subunit 3 (subunit A)